MSEAGFLTWVWGCGRHRLSWIRCLCEPEPKYVRTAEEAEPHKVRFGTLTSRLDLSAAKAIVAAARTNRPRYPLDGKSLAWEQATSVGRRPDLCLVA